MCLIVCALIIMMPRSWLHQSLGVGPVGSLLREHWNFLGVRRIVIGRIIVAVHPCWAQTAVQEYGRQPVNILC